ncbi:HGGxSTG domain-containing protein [Microvirga lotononidis]|uniref:HGGxSTG domain-containing protein n=1 Tax=Microvirga lotononidis TaxID=864069 RepID=UPI0009FBE627|nr:HGGxSTG domain-containing protein [Microvirga lotononidis]WQO32074.1 HGGxSTG domain-containing protein [Microvirga lotononidis]
MHPSIRKLLPLLQAPRCGARTRVGTPCQSPAVNGKNRCRMHGGAKGSGAPRGKANGSYKHGLFTCEAIESRRAVRELMARARELSSAVLCG